MQVNEHTKNTPKKREIKNFKTFRTSDERSPNCHLKFSHWNSTEIHQTAVALVMPITYHLTENERVWKAEQQQKKKTRAKKKLRAEGKEIYDFQNVLLFGLDTPEGSHSPVPLKHLYGVLAEAPHELLLLLLAKG